jgi:hypothetical protein
MHTSTEGRCKGDTVSLHDALNTLEMWSLDTEVRFSKELLNDILADDSGIEPGESNRT